MKITCRHKSTEALRASMKFYSYWLDLQMKKWYRRRNNLGVHMKIIHTELLHSLHNWEFDIFDQEMAPHKQYINQRHNLDRLIPLNQAIDQQVIKPPQQSIITNLNSVNFTQLELNIINKGLKHHV